MIIKPSTSLRNEYATISNLAKENQEPIFITKNGEGDSVFMSLETFKAREEAAKLREFLLKAEIDRLNGAKTYTTDEAKELLMAQIDNM